MSPSEIKEMLKESLERETYMKKCVDKVKQNGKRSKTARKESERSSDAA